MKKEGDKISRSCPNCGHEAEEGDLFCANCGGQMPPRDDGGEEVADNSCPECGHETEDGDLFCANCGGQLAPRDDDGEGGRDKELIQCEGCNQPLDPQDAVQLSAETMREALQNALDSGAAVEQDFSAAEIEEIHQSIASKGDSDWTLCKQCAENISSHLILCDLCGTGLGAGNDFRLRSSESMRQAIQNGLARDVELDRAMSEAEKQERLLEIIARDDSDWALCEPCAELVASHLPDGAITPEEDSPGEEAAPQPIADGPEESPGGDASEPPAQPEAQAGANRSRARSRAGLYGAIIGWLVGLLAQPYVFESIYFAYFGWVIGGSIGRTRKKRKRFSAGTFLGLLVASLLYYVSLVEYELPGIICYSSVLLVPLIGYYLESLIRRPRASGWAYYESPGLAGLWGAFAGWLAAWGLFLLWGEMPSYAFLLPSAGWLLFSIISSLFGSGLPWSWGAALGLGAANLVHPVLLDDWQLGLFASFLVFLIFPIIGHVLWNLFGRRRYVQFVAGICFLACLGFAISLAPVQVKELITGIPSPDKLYSAIKQDDANRVHELLTEGADANTSAPGARSPLMDAVEKGDAVMVDLLLANGASPNPPGENFPLHAAVKQNNLDMAQLLLERGARINDPDKSGHTPLLYAVEQNNLEMVKLMLAEGAEVGARNTSTGDTPLHIAARDNRSKIINLLIEFGADVNAKNKEGNTPLHSYASKQGQTGSQSSLSLGAAIWRLLASGADPDAKNNEGITPHKIDQTNYPGSRWVPSCEVAHRLRYGENATNLKSALKYYIDCVQHSPEVVHVLGASPGKHGKYSNRMEILDLVYNKNILPPPVPPEAEIMIQRARNAIQDAENKNDLLEAASLVQNALTYAPWYAKGYLLHAMILEKAGKDQEAENSLKYYYFVHPSDMRMRLLAPKAYLKLIQ